MANMHIDLPQVYPIEHPEHYKLHLACGYEDAREPGGFLQPLDDFVEDREEWDSWNWTPRKQNDFSRQYILAFMEFYPEKHRWLFGGAYEVPKHEWVGNKIHYGKTELLEESKPFIGRLKIEFERPSRNKAFCLENYYQELIVSEILPEPYTGEAFCGYDQIDIEFAKLDQIIRRQRKDWRAALQYAKGVYLITDTRTGKRYVGKASGRDGIWSRWECYVGTHHGYNDDLTRLIKKRGPDYAPRFFRFALLEYFPMKVDDDVVTDRETYWKEVLLSRGKFGYNKN
jgi:hypothetical protein